MFTCYRQPQVPAGGSIGPLQPLSRPTCREHAEVTCRCLRPGKEWTPWLLKWLSTEFKGWVIVDDALLIIIIMHYNTGAHNVAGL